MRAARTLLLVCLCVGLAAIFVAARGHLRELHISFLKGEERALRAELRQEAGEQSRALRHRLEKGPIVARYDGAGQLVRPAPPASARPWSPPALTEAAVLVTAGEHDRALEAAETSADRAAAHLARGRQTEDPACLRLAIEEEAFFGTDLCYLTGLELFRLERRAPDEAWIDSVSALLDGPSDRLARMLLKRAGCEPIGSREERSRLARLRPKLGHFQAGVHLYHGTGEGDGIAIRSVALSEFDTGRGPIVVSLAPPFAKVEMRAAIATSARAPGRAQLIVYYGFAGLILVVGTISASVAIGRATKLARAKNEFVANVTHELKTPLANIRLFAESLHEGRVKPEHEREFLETILDESARLDGLVEGLLHAARGPRLRREFIDLRALLKDAEARWRPRLEREGYSLQVEIGADLPAVRADRETLLRALDNLVDNARKYSTEDRRIVLAGRVGKAGVILTVIDRGPGIPVRDRARVLMPFTRIESADTKVTAGTGLGLSLVVACMDAHGGAISIDDPPHRGTAVSLILPVDTP